MSVPATIHGNICCLLLKGLYTFLMMARLLSLGMADLMSRDRRVRIAGGAFIPERLIGNQPRHL